MRIWTLHPQYLDPQGLVALWRETLLARAVLNGDTRGYRNHPQLERFKAHAFPFQAIDSYLAVVHEESRTRGYKFDQSKFLPVSKVLSIPATSGQLEYEWQHLLEKLSRRNPELYEKWLVVKKPKCHPLFVVKKGEMESWEKVQKTK
jgi:hypothetical protein